MEKSGRSRTNAADLVIQRTPAHFRHPAAPNADQTAVITDATVIDQRTDAAFANTWARLVAMHGGAVSVIGDFPGVTQAHYNFFMQTLQGNNNALKAAATGYVIEDQVTHGAALPAGVQAQANVQNAVLDFRIQHNAERGVVDITSTGEGGHVLEKDFTLGNFCLVWESVYPSINFAALQGVPPIVGPTAALVQDWKNRRANSKLGSRLLWLKLRMELLKTGVMHETPGFAAEADNVKAEINAFIRDPNAATIIDADFAINNANAFLVGPNAIYAQETLTNIIAAIRTRYGVVGNPPW